MRKPCCHKEDTNKGAWSEQEDQKLIDYIRQHGEGSWRTLPQAAGLLRCGKSCRLRWINYLRPHLKRGNFAEDEEDLIIKLHALLGNRWSLIAGRLPGRTDNEIKNYWNSHLRRKLVKLGIDPNNHRLNQNRIHPQSPKISTSVTSSALKNQAEEISTGIKRSQVCIEQVACNAEDRVEDNCCLRFHDLNLNLSIPTPSVAEMKEGRNANCRSNKSMEMEITQSPGTLLLFR